MKRRHFAILLALMLLVGGAFGLRYALDSDGCPNPECRCDPCPCHWRCQCSVDGTTELERFWYKTLAYASPR